MLMKLIQHTQKLLRHPVCVFTDQFQISVFDMIFQMTSDSSWSRHSAVMLIDILDDGFERKHLAIKQASRCIVPTPHH